MKRTIFFLFVALIFITECYSQNFVSTYCGTGTQGFLNGPIDSALLKSPFGLCRDKYGNIFFCEANNCIRKIDFQTGIVSTYAGTGVGGFKDGPADSAKFNNPSDLCIDNAGNIFVSDFQNQRIRKIDGNRNVTTVAGNGVAGYQDGTVNARFNYPRGICTDKNGNIYVGDSWNHRIRKIDLNGNVSTYAGGGTAIGVSSIGSYVDGNDTAARFYTPAGLTIDLQGNLYVADAYNHRIRMIDTLRSVTTLAGSGPTGQNNGGYSNGNLQTAIFDTPTEVYFDTVNNKIYISDTFNQRIRLADINTNAVSTVAGEGIAGFVNGVDTIARFNFPRGLSADSIGNVYVSDFTNNVIRKISSSTASVSVVNRQYMEVYPNPSSGIFNIKFPDSEIRKIKLHNYSGQIIKEFVSFSSEFQIDLTTFDEGYYIAVVSGIKYYCTPVKIIVTR